MSDNSKGAVNFDELSFQSWKSGIRNYARPMLDYKTLASYIDTLADSWSGVVITPDFNCYLLESCQMLANSLDLIRQGYFDAAFYAVRQAGEVLVIGVLFSDLDRQESQEKYNSWINLERFESFSKLLNLLKKKGRNYATLIEQVPALSDLFEKVNSDANKYIHKQGYDSFYHRPYGCASKEPAKIAADFSSYFKRAIGLCAALRLVVDPFPILLDDERCLNRFPDSGSIPFGSEFISECLGASFFEQYRASDFYQSWIDAVTSSFPELSDSAYLLSEMHIVDLNYALDLFNDIEYLHLPDIVGLCVIAAYPTKIAAVHMSGSCDSYVNSHLGNCGIWFADMAAPVERLGGSNVGIDDVISALSIKSAIDLQVTPDDEAWLTIVKGIRDSICVESVCPLTDEEIETLHEMLCELSEFAFKFASGELVMSEISNLEIVRRLMAKFDAV